VGPQGRSEQLLKNSPPTEFGPQTVQSVVSHYTYCAIPGTPTGESNNIGTDLKETRCKGID